LYLRSRAQLWGVACGIASSRGSWHVVVECLDFGVELITSFECCAKSEKARVKIVDEE
jgi:hypothetical protein